MKAKQRFFILIMCFLGLTVNAQGKFKCQEAFTVYEAKVTSGDYTGALTDLPELRKNCKGFNEKLYIYGETIVKSKIESAAVEEKKAFVSDLSALYTEYDKYYPQSEAAVKKAMLIHEYKLAAEEEVYKMLDAAFSSKRQSFTDYNALDTYFSLYLKKFLEDKKEPLSVEQFIEKYGEISTQVNSVTAHLTALRQDILKKQEIQALNNEEKVFLTTSEAAIESLGSVSENIDILASKHISCDKLVAYYDKNYEANKANTIWLEAMINNLFNNKCFNSAVLANGAKALHDTKPTSQSAFYLGTIAQRKNDIKGAALYFEQAAQLEPGLKKKADLYYRAASVFKNTDKGAAKKYALEAAKLNPATGKPYILLAELYLSASKECGLSAFDQKALGWLAIETIKKAEIAEAKYKPTVASMIENYTKMLPSKEEIARAGRKKGEKITYGCWINETVTIPNNK